MSRRLGDDPLTRKRAKGDAVAITQTAATDSVSYNRVFFHRRPESVEEQATTTTVVDLVEETVAHPENTVSAESVPVVVPEPVATAEPVTAEAEAPLSPPPSWTAQLVETVAASSPATVPAAAPIPPETVAPERQVDVQQAQQGGSGFFKRLFGRFQK